MKINQIVPNFNFRGNAKEALALYAKVFNGEIKTLMFDPEDNESVWHAEFYINNQRFIAVDDDKREIVNDHPMSLLVSFENDEDVLNVFEQLRDGAKIIYPIQKTGYSSCFVKFIDKFGMMWTLLTE